MRVPRGGGGGGGGVTLVSIAVTPANPLLGVSQTQQMTAIGTYSDSSTLNLTSAVTWSSSDTGVGTITNGTNGGLLSCVGTGSSTIAATIGSVSGNTALSAPSPTVGQASAPRPSLTGSGTPALDAGMVFTLPSDVATVTIGLMNQTMLNDQGDDLLCNVGGGPHNGSGGYVGGANAGLDLGSVTVPKASFVEIADVPVTLGTNRQWLLTHSLPSSGVITHTDVPYGYSATGSEVIKPLPALSGIQNPTWLWAYLRYNTVKRRFVILADGIGLVGASDDAQTTWMATLAKNNDWGVDVQGGRGDTIFRFADPTTYPLALATAQWSDADVILGLGKSPTNTLGAYQAALTALVGIANTGLARRVYMQTLAPTPSVGNPSRDDFNNDIRANWASYGLYKAPVDADLILRNPADHTVLNPIYTNDTDNWNDAAHAVMAAAWQAVL